MFPHPDTSKISYACENDHFDALEYRQGTPGSPGLILSSPCPRTPQQLASEGAIQIVSMEGHGSSTCLLPPGNGCRGFVKSRGRAPRSEASVRIRLLACLCLSARPASFYWPLTALTRAFRRVKRGCIPGATRKAPRSGSMCCRNSQLRTP